MQEYYIGPDLNTQLAALLQKLNVTKVFLVRGKKSYTSCGASDVMDAVLNGRGIKTVCFFDFLTKTLELKMSGKGFFYASHNVPISYWR